MDRFSIDLYLMECVINFAGNTGYRHLRRGCDYMFRVFTISMADLVRIYYYRTKGTKKAMAYAKLFKRAFLIEPNEDSGIIGKFMKASIGSMPNIPVTITNQEELFQSKIMCGNDLATFIINEDGDGIGEWIMDLPTEGMIQTIYNHVYDDHPLFEEVSRVITFDEPLSMSDVRNMFDRDDPFWNTIFKSLRPNQQEKLDTKYTPIILECSKSDFPAWPAWAFRNISFRSIHLDYSYSRIEIAVHMAERRFKIPKKFKNKPEKHLAKFDYYICTCSLCTSGRANKKRIGQKWHNELIAEGLADYRAGF